MKIHNLQYKGEITLMSALKKREITILGGGAIGSTIAAALSIQSNLNLKLIARKNHIQVIKKKGLQVSGKISNNFHIQAQEKIDYSLHDSLLIVTVKATDLQSSLKKVKRYIDNSTTILLLQNGYGILEEAFSALDKTVDHQKTFIGISEIGATFLNSGQISFWGGGIKIANKFQNTPYFDIFTNTFIPLKFSSDIHSDIWYKLIINSLVNPLSVLLKTKNNIIADNRFNDLKSALLKEGLAVAAAEGFKIDITVETINKFITSENISSMLQDHLKGKKSEIDFINGAICKLAQKHNLSIPVNMTITNTIKALEIVMTENKMINSL